MKKMKSLRICDAIILTQMF